MAFIYLTLLSQQHNNAYEFAGDWITNDETCDSPSEPFEPCEEKPELVAEAVEKCSIILAPNSRFHFVEFCIL